MNLIKEIDYIQLHYIIIFGILKLSRFFDTFDRNIDLKQEVDKILLL